VEQVQTDDQVDFFFHVKYPALESNTRPSLQAVGQRHSWPNMLALLGWMMDVILVGDPLFFFPSQKKKGV